MLQVLVVLFWVSIAAGVVYHFRERIGLYDGWAGFVDLLWTVVHAKNCGRQDGSLAYGTGYIIGILIMCAALMYFARFIDWTVKAAG